MSRIRILHRWMSILVVVYLLMAAVSGFVHILMSNFFAAPPQAKPSALPSVAEVQMAPAQIAKGIEPGEQILSINLRVPQKELLYQVQLSSGAPRYFDTRTGQEVNDADRAYALKIASEYLSQPQASLKKLDYLTGFTHEYMNIFRVLPVYHFEHPESGQRVYVSTATGSVTLYLTPVKAFAQKMFSAFHKLSFIGHKPTRDVVQTGLLLMILSTSVFGMVLFARNGRRRLIK